MIEQLFTENTPLGILLKALVAARNAGWKENDFKVLAEQDGRAKAALAAVRGVCSAIHAIDRGAAPYIPGGLSLAEDPSPPLGNLIWDMEQITAVSIRSLLGSPDEHVEQVFEREKDRLACAPILDYLLHHPALITHQMMSVLEGGNVIYFPRTIYLSRSLRAIRGIVQTEDGIAGVSQTIGSGREQIGCGYVLVIG